MTYVELNQFKRLLLDMVSDMVYPPHSRWCSKFSKRIMRSRGLEKLLIDIIFLENIRKPSSS